MVSSRDVAKLANVSVSTVSRAFRENCYIEEQTKKKVLDAANKLGYVPNLIARSLKKRQSKMIGIIVPDSENPFFTKVVRTIEANLKMHGYKLLITYNNEEPEEEKQNLQMFLSSQVDGIIFTPGSASNEAIINQIRDYNIALVQLYRGPYPQIRSVIADDLEEAAMATTYLLERGHRNILLITWKWELAALDARQERFKGFLRAMRDGGVAASEDNILFLDEQGGKACAKIENKLLQLRPTAVIAGTNLIAQDVIRVCKSLKITIPQDLSFIMFDDISWAELMDITTVSQPIEETGLAAFHTLMDALRQTDAAAGAVETAGSMVLQPVLMPRSSVRSID